MKLVRRLSFGFTRVSVQNDLSEGKHERKINDKQHDSVMSSVYVRVVRYVPFLVMGLDPS